MKYLYMLAGLLSLGMEPVVAQNFLPTHQYVKQQVASGLFKQRSGATIPTDNRCITATEARTWLFVDDSKLPIDNRMPWFSELVPLPNYIPCTSTSYVITTANGSVYNACGSYLYAPGYNINFFSYSRQPLAPQNPFWEADPVDKNSNCGGGASTSKSMMLAKSGVSALKVTDSTAGKRLMAMTAQAGLAAVTPLGPLNRCGIWGNDIPDDYWIAVSGTFYLSSSKTLYLGVAADNYFRVYIDDVLVANYEAYSQDAFRIWHILPVNVTTGNHTIRVEGKNAGSDAILGCELYENTVAELKAATGYSQLKILFTTRGLSGNFFCDTGLQ